MNLLVNLLGFQNSKTEDTFKIKTWIAYSNPPTEKNSNGKLILTKNIAKHTKHKMETILNIALDNGKHLFSLSISTI